MEDDKRIIELLADMLIEQRQTNTRLDKLDKGVNSLEKQQAKTNIALGDLRLSVMQLADKFEIVSQHEKRITRIEEVIFHV